jgi:predicted TPR repeat methyltransferase
MSDLHALNSEQHVSETDSFTPHRYRHFCKYLGGVERILDVGCNTGRGGAVIRSVHPTAVLVGLDMVERRVAAIPTGLYEALFVGDLSALSDQPTRFGAIVLGEVIEHVPIGEIPAFVSGLRELLVPGGRILLTTPNPHYVLLSRRGGTVLGGPHVSVHCAEALSQYLGFSGFRVVKVEGTGRVSRLLGRRFPLGLYGSYLLVAARC